MHEVAINIKLKRILVGIPEKWQEVNAEQAADLITLVFDQHSPRMQLKALEICMGKHYRHTKIMATEQVMSLMELVKWLWQSPVSVPVIPHFEIDGRRYFLPDEKLENITCLEWLLADEYYEEISQGKKESIDMLLATICREADPDEAAGLARDDIRVQLLSRKEVERRAEKMQEVDEKVKLFVMAFFSGCKKFIFDTYKNWLFQEPEEGEPIPEPTTIIEKLGWYGIFQGVAESGIFGNMENLLTRTKFKDVCIYLVTKKEQYEEMKRKNQKNTRHDDI